MRKLFKPSSIAKHAAVFVAVFLVLGHSGQFAAAPAKDHNGSISGTVHGFDGSPVADARVTLESAQARSPQTSTTDEHGHFHFKEIYPGLYDLRAYGHGFWSEWHHNVLVRKDAATNVELRLIRKKPAAKPKPPAPAATPGY
jgi:protocatechuate 3,4-dioxygenase beta subunit